MELLWHGSFYYTGNNEKVAASSLAQALQDTNEVTSPETAEYGHLDRPSLLQNGYWSPP